MNTKEKEILENKIYKLLKESMFEQAFYEDGQDTKDNKDNRETSHASKGRERTIIKWLTDDQENNAAVAAQLWPNIDDDTRRSLFSKKVRGHDSDGKEYHFTDDEVNSLYRIKNTFVHKIDENKAVSVLTKLIREGIENALNQEELMGDEAYSNIDDLKNDLRNHGFIVSDRSDGSFNIISKKYRGLTGQPEWVAHYSKNRNAVFPCHGYFAPHPCGKLIAKICKVHNIEFNNN